MSAALELTPVSFKKPREHLPRLSIPYVPGRRHERFWTDAEDAVLREHFPNGGHLACQRHLGQRSRLSIFNRAHKLGLHVSRLKKRARLVIPDDIDDRIRAAWPLLKGRGAVDGLARDLDVPDWWLSKRAVKLGLSKPWKKEPPWTAAEIALMRKVPLHDPVKSSKIFREHGFARSPAAIMVKAKRLDLSRRHKAGLSATALAKILGMDNKTTSQWCVSGDLKSVKRPTKKLPQQGGDVWLITRMDARKFVIDNLERIDIRKVDKFAFVDLLVHAKHEDGTHHEMG